MPFIPNSTFGMAYMAALAIAGVITLRGEHKEARRILWVLCLNWLVTRANVSLWPSNDVLWLANDFMTVAALAVYGRTVPAKACAILFFIIGQFDIAMGLGWASFAPVAAISDLLGYIVLIIMAGAAYDVGGFYDSTRHLPSNNNNHRLGFMVRVFSYFQDWRTISARSGVPSRNGSKSNIMATAGRMKNE
jgi:hypothetical protein